MQYGILKMPPPEGNKRKEDKTMMELRTERLASGEYSVFSRVLGREIFRGTYEEVSEFIDRYIEETEGF